MIARVIIWLLLLIVLPDYYLEHHHLRWRKGYTWRRRSLWWVPSAVMVVYSVILASIENFVPDNILWVEIYLFLMGVIVVPKAIFALCSYLGVLWHKAGFHHGHWSNVIGSVLAMAAIAVYVYGFTGGVRRLDMKHIDLYFPDLPASFEGYRIVHFSDAHVGTFNRPYSNVLRRDIDSINAQHADMICFTGDLQNIQPSDIYPHAKVLSKLQAPDGVFAVLGNHDYSLYVEGTPELKTGMELEVQRTIRSLGWRLLMNEHATVRRGHDSLVVVGTENDARPPLPLKGDYHKALRGVGRDAFVVMLQHDPSAWDRHVLPLTNAQLTLSGHTHAGQVSLLGYRPTQIQYKEDYGLYEDHGRYLYVTSGIGALVPFRIGASAEITVVTLHQTKPL